MPTYEYICAKCGPFDLFQSMSDAPLSSCPTCGEPVKRKINGGTGVIFKGSGFYKNDSRKAASSDSAPSGSSSKGASGCDACAASPASDKPAKDAV
jgi:putative FmdB family regulatory protein